ncbi:hypothetical protein [Qiania dongpingensis]|uniref:Uncharacterized protein n=1 Tax=Qiania dongpingensis TaxID=2763669 RepID=A0A7G9G2S6_9FIRM|nr:hypothetical protein [Qiania dongpingensis]QNM05108.1 hypothetical protein H9Q78_11730 [Qiania dongpingensis]
MKKHYWLCLMCIVLLSSFSLVTYASEDEGVVIDESGVTTEDPIRYDLIGPSPRWAYISNTSLSLSYNGSGAVCYVYISGMNNCTKITGDLILYKKSGSSFTRLITWSGLTTTGDYLSREKEYAVSRGYTYKLVFDGTAYGTTGSEPIYLSTESTF